MTTYSEGKGKGRNGEDLDSDEDPYHITMPFRKSDELRRKIFEDPQFESDEEFEPGFEEQDKVNAENLKTQNDILDCMQKSIERM